MDIDDLFDRAWNEHQAGNLEAAQLLYAKVIKAKPEHCDALHLMGVLAHQAGRNDVAEQMIREAIDIKPAATYFGNLGLVLAATSRLDEAIEAYEEAVSLRPTFAEAHNNLGNALRLIGKPKAAIDAYRRAIECRAVFAEAHNNLGLALFDAGQVEESIRAYRDAIAIQPTAADARNNLGSAYSKLGELDRAIAVWREALSIQPNYPQALSNLAGAMKQLDRVGEAETLARKAISLAPNSAEAWNTIGVIEQGRRNIPGAIDAYRNAISARLSFAEAHYNLAIALHAAGDIVSAIDSCRAALKLRPFWPEACNNLGIWLSETARPAEAIAVIDAALLVRPDYAEAHSNRGNILRQLGKASDAVASYRRAVALRPEYAEARSNLATALKQTGQIEDAVEQLREAIAIQPTLSEAHNNLGNALKEAGEVDQAIEYYEKAVSLSPGDAQADSNRIYTMYFSPKYSAEQILAEHQRWNHRHATRLTAQSKPHTNVPTIGRRLKVGYVAPDFRDHCQSMFTIPLLSNHDRQRVEVFCYSDVAAPDATTERIKSLAHHWREIAGRSDADVAEQIRGDGIDVLVDLTLHMSNNRLQLFAQRPAPVQSTWLGYPGTTGLEAMNYRISDGKLDPPGYDDYYTETTVRLADSFWCYDPLTDGPEVGPLPAVKNGSITFGCLNNHCKVNEPTLWLWGEVMRQVPKSRMILLAPAGRARSRALEAFSRCGIDADRIEFVDRQPRAAYLQLYRQIDLALDTFPYNGHTTSLDAYWMGVPVVTKPGRTAVGRGGFSQLDNLGLASLCGADDDAFIRTAVSLAGDIDRLRGLRAGLRDRLRTSPLMNGRLFARNMERSYEWMWRRWVSTQPAPAVLAAEGKMSLRLMTASRRRPPAALKKVG